MSNRAGIIFQVETSRILEILASEIYDSPLALLRENVQNAYDAVLMRSVRPDFSLSDARVDVRLEPTRVVIRDNGIGMTEEVLRNNFWRAGSSGKRSEAAKEAGVVGTFGIGAMANFGVARAIEVQSRAAGEQIVLRSSALRDELSIQEECIRLAEVDDPDFGPGTRVEVDLDEANRIDVNSAVSYLRTYVQFLTVPVYCNDQLLSQEDWGIPEEAVADTTESLGTGRLEAAPFRANLDVTSFADGSKIIVRVSDLTIGDRATGDALLIQSSPPLMGFRNRFGLAPIPTSGHYSFGGFFNASFLQPTAGREALSRDSIQTVTRILNQIERVASELIASHGAADRNAAFQQYARSGPVEWARKVTVRVAPTDDRIPLEQLKDTGYQYYPGRDPERIKEFSSPESPLVVLDQGQPRRALQDRYIREVLSLPKIPDEPQVRVIPGPELTYSEATFLVRATAILLEEYLIDDVEVSLATISHGVQVLVRTPGNPSVHVLISRDHPQLQPVIEASRTAPDAFGGLVRDFVRMHVYEKVASHVPSATRQGAEALIARMRRTRELFRYDEEELGALEPLLADLLSGEATVGEAIRRAATRGRPQPQRVTHNQVGSVEAELPDVVHDEIASEQPSLEASPPIQRPELETRMKILTTTQRHPSLNGFRMLLGMSDRLCRTERLFFEIPHQTRVMWAEHRIIFVFTHANGELSLYYDIEMPDPLVIRQGGMQLPTTTLITKRRIFVPIPDELTASFDLVNGERKFHVRFDTVTR